MQPLNINMSCKSKLVNLPSLSDIDKQFKKLIPSNLDGMSDKLKAKSISDGLASIAGDIKNQVSTQVGNFVGGVTGKLGEVGGLFSTLGSDMKAGITSDLNAIKPGIANALSSAKAELKKDLDGISSLLSCEDETTADSHTETQEASKIKSAVMATSVTETKSLSNKEIKSVSEVPAVKEQKTQQITNSTISNGAPIIASAQSNKQTTTTQNQSLSALQTTAVINEDKFEKDMEKYPWWESYHRSLNSIKDELVDLQKIYKSPSLDALDFDIGKKNVSNAYYNTIIRQFEILRDAYNLSHIDEASAAINLKLIVCSENITFRSVLFLEGGYVEKYRSDIKWWRSELLDPTLAEIKKNPKIVVIVDYCKYSVVAI